MKLKPKEIVVFIFLVLSIYSCGGNDNSEENNSGGGEDDSTPWTSIADGLASANLHTTAITLDSSGGIILAGFLSGDNSIVPGGSDGYLAKYTSTGSKEWSVRLNGARSTCIGCPSTGQIDRLTGVSVSSDNSIYVTGYTHGNLVGGSSSLQYPDPFIVKYNSSGIHQWTHQAKQPYTTYGTSSKVAIDSNDKVFLIFESGDRNRIIKFSSIGDIEMGDPQFGDEIHCGIADFNGSSARGMVFDSEGNLYFSGHYNGATTGNTQIGFTDYILSKCSSTGELQWMIQYGSTNYDYSTGLAIDSNNNLYLIGYTNQGSIDSTTPAGGFDIFLAKYNSSGVKQWVSQFGSSEDDIPNGIAVDSSDNIYLVGQTEGSLDGNSKFGAMDYFISKYNSSGTRLWTKQFGTNYSEAANAIVIDSKDNLFITGYPGYPSIGSLDAFVYKFNTSGEKQ